MYACMPPRPGERLVIALEKWIKGALFKCSMCGNCLLDVVIWESILPRLLQQVRLSEGGSPDECAVDLS